MNDDPQKPQEIKTDSANFESHAIQSTPWLKKHLRLIVATALFLGFATGGFVVWSMQNTNEVVSNSIVETNASVDTKPASNDVIDAGQPTSSPPKEKQTIKTHKLKAIGYTIEYPSNWELVESFDDHPDRQGGESVVLTSPNGFKLIYGTSFAQFGGGCDESEQLSFIPRLEAATELNDAQGNEVSVMRIDLEGVSELRLVSSRATIADEVNIICPNTAYYRYISFDYKNSSNLEYGQYPNFFYFGASWEDEPPSETDIDEAIKIMSSVRL